MDFIKKTYLATRRLGLGNTLRIIRNSFQRDWQELKAHRSRIPKPPPQAPGLLQNAIAVQKGGVFHFERARVEISFLAQDLARISWEPGLPPLPYAITKVDWPPVPVELTPCQDGWQLTSPELQVQISQEGSLRYLNPRGILLREELPPLHIGTPGENFPLAEIQWSQTARLESEAAIFGLGLRSLPFDLRGQTCMMWNSDPPGGYRSGTDPLYLGIPVFLVVHDGGSYLLFFENSFPGIFQFGQPLEKLLSEGLADSGTATFDLAKVSFSGGLLRQYFILGTPERALERFSELTGRPLLPPRWSLGYHHSRWGFQNEADIHAIATGFYQHDLPISAIHLDIDYQDGFRVFTVNHQKFPDLPRLAQTLSKRGVRLIGILNPGVKLDRHFPVFQQGLEEHVFCRRPDGKLAIGMVWPGWSVFPDFTDPHAREWWGGQYRHLTDLGFSGVWHDMNEPTSFSAWGSFSLPSNTGHSLEGRGGDHRQAHNLYGLLMNQAGFTALRRLKPNHRPWLLTRSGWAGLAPYAWTWTADLESSWDGLGQTISSLLGLSLSGVPYCGADIGGFQGDPEPELYLRWFQLAAFTPFFRTHSSLESKSREPWNFGEPALSIIRKFLRLRYRLMPYLYTLAWTAAQSGVPLMRPLFWNNPDMRDLWRVDNAFLLGDALLVAPVLEPGADRRKVILPPGGWYSFWNAEFYRGSTEVSLSAPLDQIPLLVRAGSLLPLDEGERLALHLYPPENGTASNVLFDDSGDGYAASRVDQFAIHQERNLIEITRTSKGDFQPGGQQLDLHVHGVQVHQVWVDGCLLPDAGNCISTPWFDFIRIKGKLR
ncbi:MAG TPA: glycoside hydrolase family 31 protein [Anaerolineales bacterium]|nr:glycoside hydrolase family 31 protein [Anaerolineales bacterium]